MHFSRLPKYGHSCLVAKERVILRLCTMPVVSWVMGLRYAVREDLSRESPADLTYHRSNDRDAWKHRIRKASSELSQGKPVRIAAMTSFRSAPNLYLKQEIIGLRQNSQLAE